MIKGEGVDPSSSRNEPFLYIRIVNQSKKQHELAISLLKELGLDYIRLERQINGHYHYHAWTSPLKETNGHAKHSRRGTVRLKTVR
jgi:hypothetical protein